ncbi:MAG: ATP-binding protein [Clostridiaceae bacterium]|nr:ATP-binding protein [Clostridiaceae bacterium]
MKRMIGREINRIYEQRRLRAELARDSAVRYAYQQHPRLEQLDREIAAAGADLLLEAIEPGRPKAARTRMTQLQETRRTYLLEKQVPADFDQPRYNCPLCRDTGEQDGVRCSCYQALLVPLLFDEANLNSLNRFRFGMFDASLFSDQASPALYQSDLSPRQQILGLKRVSEQFVAQFDAPETRSMLFIGKPGTGKTFLMACIAQELLAEGRSVLYLPAPQLFDYLQEQRILLSSYSPDPIRLEHSLAMKDSILNCSLLLIDDLGTESGASSRYADLLGVIDSRQGPGRKMIISSNADPASLRDHYDERLLSRLVGGFAVYRFFGEDVRLALNRRRRGG